MAWGWRCWHWEQDLGRHKGLVGCKRWGVTARLGAWWAVTWWAGRRKELVKGHRSTEFRRFLGADVKKDSGAAVGGGVRRVL